METTHARQDLNEMLESLLHKYGVTPSQKWQLLLELRKAGDGLALLSGQLLMDTDLADSYVPLMPWRNERRFTELKQIVETQTIEHVSTLRLCCLTDSQSSTIEQLLYREFDLCEWLAGSTITGVFASITEGRAANVLARLANGMLCGIEIGVALPAGSTVIDRHELIARRGVASDRVVDTQMPQSSIYTFTANGQAEYTDTDAELFGLSGEEITIVRAAYDTLADPAWAEQCRKQHSRLVAMAKLAIESDNKQQWLTVKEVQS